MTISWTNFQILSVEVTSALKQDMPQSVTGLVSYINIVTEALGNVNTAEGNYTKDKSESVNKKEYDDYDNAAVVLRDWSIRLRDMLKILYNMYPLVETITPLSSSGDSSGDSSGSSTGA